MNSSQTQNLGSRSNWRRIGITLSLSLLVLFNLLPVAAQRGPKRITSVWTATTAEGSRVHVVSDSPINDYEGYTRGGRFYVKIPLADLPSARGSLLGRGFDDVQIQRYGDGIIISFRLQPGSSARVEQAANRLEVVFTTPGGSRSAVAGARETDDAVRTRARRISDSAGPSPAMSPSSSRRERTARTVAQPHDRPGSGSVAQRTTGATARNSNASGVDSSKSRDNRNSNSAEKPSPTPAVAAKSSPSPTPISSPTPAASPTTTPSNLSGSASPNSSPIATATPAASDTSGQPLPVATPSKAANNKDNDWKSRAHYWQVWAELNWVPLLIGVIVALALLVLLFFWRAAKRSRDDAPESSQSTQTSSETAADASPTPTGDAGQSASAASATGQNQSPAVSNTTPSNATPSEPIGHQGEELEREVFEL